MKNFQGEIRTRVGRVRRRNATSVLFSRFSIHVCDKQSETLFSADNLSRMNEKGGECIFFIQGEIKKNYLPA